jgi:hypothetical protein
MWGEKLKLVIRRAAAVSATFCIAEPTLALSKQKPDWEWAYPSPYDTGVEVDRFSDTSHFLCNKPIWDLKGLVDDWLETEHESWPWIWTQPNPTGPHHCFIGASSSVLPRAREIMKADPSCNITCICATSDLEEFAPIESYYQAGCAVIEIPVRQFDTTNRILLLDDERIVCFDHAYVS